MISRCVAGGLCVRETDDTSGSVSGRVETLILRLGVEGVYVIF